MRLTTTPRCASTALAAAASCCSRRSRQARSPSWDARWRFFSSRETMITSGVPDRHLNRFVEGGQAWPERWIRVENLIDDVLGLLEEHHVEVTPKKLKKIRSLKPQNVGYNYERDLSVWK